MISPINKTQIYTISSESPKNPVMAAKNPSEPAPSSLLVREEVLSKGNVPVSNFPNFNNIGSKIDIKV